MGESTTAGLDHVELVVRRGTHGPTSSKLIDFKGSVFFNGKKMYIFIFTYL